MRQTPAVFALLTILCPGSASAGDFVGVRDGNPFLVKSQSAMRMEGIVQQRFDWSCASASMATLIGEKFGMQVPEQAFFDLIVSGLADDGDALRSIETRGMSVAHMQQMAGSVGLLVQGVTRSLAGLLEAEPLPVIARIAVPAPDDPVKTMRHWVVVQAVTGDRVLIRDPVRGNRRMPTYAFAAAWLEGGSKGLLVRVEAQARLFGRLDGAPSDQMSVHPSSAASAQPAGSIIFASE